MRVRAYLLPVMLVTAATGLVQAQTCDPVRGPIGWWPADGTAADLVSPANNGTLLNGATFLAGADGQAFSLDGVDDRVDVADAPALRPQRFTLAAWVRMDVITTQACIICKQVGGGTANSYSLWLAGGVLRGGMFGFAEAVAATPIPAGTLLHTAVTWDGVALRLYLDGRQIATAAGPAGAISYDASQVIIGGDDNGLNAYTGFVDGIIDEPMIYGRALSPCEIRALYRARGHGACKGDSDADSIRDVQDNCPVVSNLGQQDVDADGAGDVCDCAPADPQVAAAPGDYAGLYFESRDTMTWCDERGATGEATTYDVLRGDLDDLPVGTGLVTCRSHCLPPLSGLVAWWPGDGSAGALAGGNGTFQNGAASGSGWIRQALAFDGVDDRVQTPPLTLGNAFSVAAWVNSDVLNQGAYRRIVESQYTTGFELGSDATGAGYKFIVKSPSSPYGVAQGGTINPGSWQLVVGTYDGTTGRLYVNGAAVASDIFTPPGTVGLPVYIGAYFLGGIGWNGNVDEVQVYDRALSTVEVRSIYEAASAGECKAALGGVDSPYAAPWAVDGETPAPGHGFWYLFRGKNACGQGSYGAQTNGTPRASTVCD
jgi:hypothetical protein